MSIVKDRRLQLGITRRVVAERAGLSVGQVARFESGGALPLHVACDLADALGVTLDQLAGLEPIAGLYPQEGDLFADAQGCPAEVVDRPSKLVLLLAGLTTAVNRAEEKLRDQTTRDNGQALSATSKALTQANQLASHLEALKITLEGSQHLKSMKNTPEYHTLKADIRARLNRANQDRTES